MADTNRLEPGSPAFEKVRAGTRSSFRFVENVGIDLLEYGRGHCRMMMPLEGNVNHGGIMYAGSLFTLAEMPGGVLFGSVFDSKRFYPIVGEVKIRFALPAGDAFVTATMSDGEIDRITTELEATGRAKYVLDLELTDGDANVVSTSSGIYFALSH